MREAMAARPHGSMYEFALEGADSVAWGWLDNFKAIVARYGGKVTKDRTKDLEA